MTAEKSVFDENEWIVGLVVAYDAASHPFWLPAGAKPATNVACISTRWRRARATSAEVARTELAACFHRVLTGLWWPPGAKKDRTKGDTSADFMLGRADFMLGRPGARLTLDRPSSAVAADRTTAETVARVVRRDLAAHDVDKLKALYDRFDESQRRLWALECTGDEEELNLRHLIHTCANAPYVQRIILGVSLLPAGGAFVPDADGFARLAPAAAAAVCVMRTSALILNGALADVRFDMGRYLRVLENVTSRTMLRLLCAEYRQLERNYRAMSSGDRLASKDVLEFLHAMTRREDRVKWASGPHPHPDPPTLASVVDMGPRETGGPMFMRVKENRQLPLTPACKDVAALFRIEPRERRLAAQRLAEGFRESVGYQFPAFVSLVGIANGETALDFLYAEETYFRRGGPLLNTFI